jgi:hypothetical protein
MANVTVTLDISGSSPQLIFAPDPVDISAGKRKSSIGRGLRVQYLRSLH